jgi:hypothetical protein
VNRDVVGAVCILAEMRRGLSIVSRIYSRQLFEILAKKQNLLREIADFFGGKRENVLTNFTRARYLRSPLLK